MLWHVQQRVEALLAIFDIQCIAACAALAMCACYMDAVPVMWTSVLQLLLNGVDKLEIFVRVCIY